MQQRIQLTLLSVFFVASINAQVQTIDSSMANFATVNVLVTDMKGKPSKGEKVYFKSEKTQKYFNGRSDAQGRFSLVLPVGSRYSITIKNITDTAKYSVMDIAAPGPDEYYTEPFTVHVKFNLAKSYTLDHVHFDFGKATLRPESSHELDELVEFLNNKETTRIEIAGHTDNVGNDADNLTLSQQRADAIRNYVIKKGIAATRIQAKGYGATQPVADNNTEKGRQMNRRTEVRVL